MLVFQACSPDKRKIPDVSHIEAPLEIVRFEQALYKMDTLNFEASLQQLSDEFPEFAELFTSGIIEAGPLEDMNEAQRSYLRGFITSPVYRSVYDTTQLTFPNMEDVHSELQQSLKLFRYYFPEIPAPTRLTTFVSAFNYSAIIYGDNELGASLDMYLGAEFDYQRYNPNATIFSNYLLRTYNKDHLIANLMNVLVGDIVGNQRGNRLLDIIVDNGKKLYILDQLLPTAADTVKFNVSGEQWQWLQENEKNLWAHFLSEELLYNTNHQDIRRLTDPGPSGAPVLPEESPAQAGNYIGFKIIQAFMNRQPDLPLSDLLLFKDGQEILEISKYKPPRD